MCVNNLDLLYLVMISIGTPVALTLPSCRSSHNTKLSLVYGAGPYVVSHHVGIIVKPNISQGWVCGRSVSNACL